MRVALRGGNVGVAEQLLHFVEAAAVVDKKGGKIVTKVVDADVGNPRIFPDFIPGVMEKAKRLARFTAGKHIIGVIWRPAFQYCHSGTGKGNIPRLSGLTERHGPDFAFEINIGPLSKRCGYFSRVFCTSPAKSFLLSSFSSCRPRFLKGVLFCSPAYLFLKPFKGVNPEALPEKHFQGINILNTLYLFNKRPVNRPKTLH